MDLLRLVRYSRCVEKVYAKFQNHSQQVVIYLEKMGRLLGYTSVDINLEFMVRGCNIRYLGLIFYCLLLL